jgi:hypothetical protein
MHRWADQQQRDLAAPMLVEHDPRPAAEYSLRAMALSLDPDPVFVRGREYQGLIITAICPREIVNQTCQVAEHLKRLEFAPLCDVGSFMRIPGSVRLQ